MAYAIENRTMNIPNTAYAIAIARLHREGYRTKVAVWIAEREVILALSDMGFDPNDYDHGAISRRILNEINGETE